MKRLLVILATLLLAGDVYAQGISIGAPIRTVVGSLPGAPSNSSQTYIVTDGASSSDCTVGGGSTLVHCAWTGAAFQALGGGSGTGTVDGLTGDSGGTTTGANVTIAGGTNVTTTRAADTITIDASGGGHTIEDEGTPLTQRSTLNFTGGGVTCVDDAAGTETDCAIPLGAPINAQYLVGALNGALTNETLLNDLTSLNSLLGTSIADGPHTTVGASHIDAITEIDATLRSGTDGQLVTGTPTTGECAEFDANGDVIGSGAGCAVGDVVGPASSTDHAIARFDLETGKVLQNTSAATIDDSGNVSANSYSTPDSDGSNRVELFGNPSGDVSAPTGDNLSLFTDDTGGLFAKRPADGAGGFTLASGAGRAVYIGQFTYAADPIATTKATLVDEREDDGVGCVSRSTNQIVISCAGTWRFTAAARWTWDRATSPNWDGGVYWYDDTNGAYAAGTSEVNSRGCGGMASTTEYVLAPPATIPASFSIYPIACGTGTLGGETGELVATGNGRYVVERVR